MWLKSLLKASCFNTQPPEGGWAFNELIEWVVELFQHTAARRRLDDVVAFVED